MKTKLNKTLDVWRSRRRRETSKVGGAYITPKYITMFIRVIYLLKKSKDDLVENLGNKLNPFIYAMGIVGVLMSICLMIVTVMK